MKFGQSTILVLALAVVMTDVSSAFVTPTTTSKILHTTTPVTFSSTPLSLTPDALTDIPLDLDIGSSLHLSAVSIESVTSSPLFTYFAEKVIDASIPAVFSLAVIFFFFSQVKKAREAGSFGADDEAQEANTAISELYNDLYSSTSGKSRKRGMNPFQPPGPPPLPKNLGIPQREYLTITNMNERYDAYDFSLTRATDSKARAASDFRAKAFDRALGLALRAESNVDGSTMREYLAPRVKAKLIQAEKKFLGAGMEKIQALNEVEGALAAMAMDEELAKLGEKAEKMGLEDLEVIDAEVTSANQTATANQTETTSSKSSSSEDEIKSKSKKSLIKSLTKLQTEIKELELDFIQKVLATVGPKRAVGLRNALLGDIAVRGAGSLLSSIEDRPLSKLLNAGSHDDGSRRKAVFVMNFPGDVQASQLNELREEITGVIRTANPGDEALVVLQSGGGTVTGYGLAAGQLVRLKEKGLKLTIAVEQVAASGGYMMSCVADKIIASPFAVIGSIGVISEVPNVYERLTKEGIQYQTVTAGKFKRTLTPTKKITKEDVAKSEEEIGEIFELFKGWVAQNRPQLDIDKVATGETWFGPAALERGLCDEIRTVDDVILGFMDDGCDVYQVKYDPPPEIPNTLAAFFASEEDGGPVVGRGGDDSMGRRAIRWLVQSFAEEVRDVTSVADRPLQEKYMAQEDIQDRIR